MATETVPAGTNLNHLPAMPREVVNGISRELYNVLALLRSAMTEVDAIGTDQDLDTDGLMDAGGRATSLLAMSRDRVRAMLDLTDPYK